LSLLVIPSLYTLTPSYNTLTLAGLCLAVVGVVKIANEAGSQKSDRKKYTIVSLAMILTGLGKPSSCIVLFALFLLYIFCIEETRLRKLKLTSAGIAGCALSLTGYIFVLG